MNSVGLLGRLTSDPEKKTSGQTTFARFTLAVDRRVKAEGQQTADFISCVAFGKTAEFVDKYFHKGSKMALTGRIQTSSYEKDGHKIYSTDVIAETVEFAESKKVETREDFAPIPDQADLPF